jgi:hypothetical protein
MITIQINHINEVNTNKMIWLILIISHIYTCNARFYMAIALQLETLHKLEFIMI